MALSNNHHWRELRSLTVSGPILVIVALFLVSSCGKKAAPSLASYEKPPAPAVLNISQRENGMLLSWGFPADREKVISGFIILRERDSAFNKIASVGSDMRAFIDTDIKEGMKYTYKVVSQNQRGILSADSNSVTVVVLTPPEPPANILWNIGSDSLSLSWEKTGKEFRYNVYRTFEKGKYGMPPVNKSPLSENFFKDNFFLDRPVYYTIRSLVKNTVAAEGPASQEITVNPSDFIPAPPRDIRFFAASDKIYLYWKEADAVWITGFRVYRRFSGSDYALIAETQIPSFLDKDTPHVKRDYRIAAVGPSREGPAAEITGVLFQPE